MRTNYSLFIGAILAPLLAIILLFSTNAQADGRNHVYGNQHNHYYGGPDYRYYNDHDRGHRRHHKRAKRHRHNHYNNYYYPQVRRDVYYGPQYYQPPRGGHNDFIMGLRSGNTSIMIGY